MSKEFVVGAPRQSIRNSRDKAEVDQAIDLLAEKLAPVVAKLLEGEAVTNGSNGRKIRTEELTSRHFQGLPKGDEWDSLPDGDDAPAPAAPGGSHFDSLPD